MNELKNKFENERIFILGNGPSLKEVPLESLDREYTFGINRIDKLYQSTQWRPDFYLTPWSTDLKQMSNIEFIKIHQDLGIPCFVRKNLSHRISGQNVHFIELCKLRYSEIPFHDASINEIEHMNIMHLLEYWSSDPRQLTYEYHAMYVAFQLAVYMGFKQIYLLGVDLGLEYQNPHMVCNSGLDPYLYQGDKIEYLRDAFKSNNLIQSLINGVSMKLILNYGYHDIIKYLYSEHNKSSDHFDENYIDVLKIKDRRSDEREIIKSHVAAKRICSRSGVEIYNATPNSNLDVYDHVSLDNLLSC